MPIIGPGITVGAGITVTNTPPPVLAGLQLYLDAGNPASYPGTGTTWTDLSPSANNGTFNSAPTYTAANGGSLIFNGSIEVTLASTINLPGNFSINWWEYLTGTISNNQCIIFGPNGNDINHYEGKIRFYAPGNYGTSPTTTLPNVWYNWCYVRSGTTLSLYLNGSLNISETVPVGTAQISLVARGNGGFLTGQLPTIQVYNSALSAGNVMQNYQALRDRYGI